jgi:peptide/nickel transport system ATP-binding protein
MLVQPLNLRVQKGEIVGIAGESGSGKTLTLLSVAGLLPPSLSAAGSLHFQGKYAQHCWTGREDKEVLRHFRRQSIGFIFQEPLSALNPTMRCGKQLLECMDEEHKQRKLERALSLLRETGLNNPERIMRSYPFQISGGQRQRLMIAMALANNPELLLADEPTTALDAELKHQVSALMTDLCRSRGVALLLVSHDLELLGSYCDALLVMQNGQVVEQGSAAHVLSKPSHTYTRMLLECRPSLDKRGHTLPAPGELVLPIYRIPESDASEQLIIRVDQKIFPSEQKPVLQDIAFSLRRGETICILGQSGSGKSTLARIISGLDRDFDGTITDERHESLPKGMIQLVFQDPLSALNPNQKVLKILEEAIRHGGKNRSKGIHAREKAQEILRDVRLPEHTWNAYPHELSGGQCQRVCIARALCANPEVIILDESVSALDPSVQASVLNLLASLQQQKKLGYLFITHDLDVAAWFSHRILVLHEGKTDALDATETLMNAPPTPYTKHLFSFR